jgi:hypothetical protein
MGPAPSSPDNEASHSVKPRKLISRFAELVFWGVFPFAMILIAAIVSVVLRTSDVVAPLLITFVPILAVGACFLLWPNRRLGIGRARAALLVAIGLMVSAPAAFMASLTPEQRAELEAEAEQREVQEAAAREAVRLEAAATAQREALQRRAEADRREAADQSERARAEAAQAEADRVREEQARIDYVQKLERELATVTAQSLLQNTDTPEDILLTVVTFILWAGIYDEGASLELLPEQQAARQRFKQRVIALQVQVFPELRNRFGPAMSRREWESDREVRTFGTGYRTVEFTWAGFAANRNIAEYHRSVNEDLEGLRFQRAQYRWYRGANRFQYYTLETPSDRDLIVSRDGALVVLED